jgi:hypothetical protein
MMVVLPTDKNTLTLVEPAYQVGSRVAFQTRIPPLVVEMRR